MQSSFLPLYLDTISHKYPYTATCEAHTLEELLLPCEGGAVRIELKGSIPGPYQVNDARDVVIIHHYRYVKDDGVAIPTAHGAQVEMALGAVHVFMSPEEADKLGKNLQTLSGVEKTVGQLGMAKALLDDVYPVSGLKVDKIGRALHEVIGYLEAQRDAAGAQT